MYVDQKIVPDDTPSVHDAHSPSLQPVAFAIRHILKPSLIFDQIPDLLDLLTTVETLRKIAVAKAGDALTWNTFYKKRTEQATVLTDKEEAAVQKIVDEDEDMRSIYIKILSWCFELVSDPVLVFPSCNGFWTRPLVGSSPCLYILPVRTYYSRCPPQ